MSQDKKNKKYIFGMKISYGDISAVFDVEKFATIVGAEESYFKKYGQVIQTEFNGPLIFKDNGAKILAVAHLDTFQKPAFHGWFYASFDTIKSDPYLFKPIGNNLNTNIEVKPDGKVAFIDRPLIDNKTAYMCCAASGLDDRLGAYIILELLPQIGVECDYLLTTNEERGNSTAQGFKKHIMDGLGKKYNWIVEFDRKGRDVVTYKYDTKEFKAAIQSVDFVHGVGSYSDICDMFQMGVCALNVGVGYQRPHSKDSWFCVDTMFVNLNKFYNFYQIYKDDTFEIDTSKWISKQERRAQATKSTYVYPYSGYQQQDYEYGKKFDEVWFTCKKCHKKHELVKKGEFFICDCGNEYWRGADKGNIFIKTGYENGSEGYKLYHTIESYNRSTKIVTKRPLWNKCSLCTTGSYVYMKTIDGLTVCPACEMKLYSICEWCQDPFFSLGSLGELTLCEACEEYMYQYFEPKRDDDKKVEEEQQQRSIVVYDGQNNQSEPTTSNDGGAIAITCINEEARAEKNNS